jgi:hypothetical protein
VIVKILGIADIIAAIIFWGFGMFHIFPKTLVMFFAFYLLIKGVVFLISADIASILDVSCAILMFIALNMGMPKLLIIIITLFLLQKGLFSLVS